MTFRGTYEHALDAKHRLTIPAKFRGALADGVVLAPSPEIGVGAPRTIAIWIPAEYDEFTRTVLAGLNPSEPRARELKRFYNSMSFDTELDSANRVMVPSSLMSYAGLTKEVVVTGSGECLEVWDRTRHAENFAEVLDRIPQLTASLGHTA